MMQYEIGLLCGPQLLQKGMAWLPLGRATPFKSVEIVQILGSQLSLSPAFDTNDTVSFVVYIVWCKLYRMFIHYCINDVLVIY